ncbi:MAG: zinc-ribbon domain-containing protein [Bacillota bacterium]
MYSVKPGRGPSLMGGIGGIVAAVFGVIWTVGAISMGAPSIFPLFGLVFIVAALGGAVYNFYNAASRNRMSTFDITAGNEETDPIAEALGYADRPASVDRAPAGPRRFPGEYCPFCGMKVGADFNYCPKCGRDI